MVCPFQLHDLKNVHVAVWVIWAASVRTIWATIKSSPDFDRALNNVSIKVSPKTLMANFGSSA
jgi:hypothetical protein